MRPFPVCLKPHSYRREFIGSVHTMPPTGTPRTVWCGAWGSWPPRARSMDEFSRPATLEDLKLLLRSLDQHGADYLLIGGYALAAHGYQRATTDIDVVVPGNAQAGQRVKDALMALPDGAAKDIEPTWFEEGENIRVADAFVVDLMLNANGQTYDTLRQYAETIELDGIPVKTITLEGLLLTKRTMRDKDAADRIIIERALEEFRSQTRSP